MKPDDRRHGTPTGYTDGGCREACCRAAVARAWNIYELRRVANNGQPLTVPKIGAVRRLQALMALGWPRRELARRAGWRGDALGALIYGRRQVLLLDTHRRIVYLYEALSGTPGPSQRSRAIAATRGWATPLAWDDIDIDDPDARPDPGADGVDTIDEVVVERILAGDGTPAHAATPAERHAVVTAWTAAGRSLASLARLTGWKPERYITPNSQEAA